MHIQIDFELLVIANVFLILLGYGVTAYGGMRGEPLAPPRYSVISVILLILAVIVVLADIIFMVLRLVR
jgi:hypothetical protein